MTKVEQIVDIMDKINVIRFKSPLIDFKLINNPRFVMPDQMIIYRVSDDKSGVNFIIDDSDREVVYAWKDGENIRIVSEGNDLSVVTTALDDVLRFLKVYWPNDNEFYCE
jgi:hypothetical protein